MNRRNFLASGLTAVGGLLTSTPLISKPVQWFPQKKITTISYNVQALKGYPRTDDTQFRLDDVHPQMAERFALELALYKPDIITFQEAPTEDEVKKVADKLNMAYTYFPGGFPGAVLTRFTIVNAQNCPLASKSEAGELFSRHWGTALLKTPDEEIRLYSAHLHPSDDAIRAREVEEVLRVMDRDSEESLNFIFQGDLNHEPIQEEYRMWVNHGLQDCYMKKGVESRDTIKSTFPNRTVDYIWVNQALSERLLRCRVLFEGNFRTNPLDARSFALSDHLPIMAEFK